MKKADRIRKIQGYIKQQVYNGLKQDYPGTVAYWIQHKVPAKDEMESNRIYEEEYKKAENALSIYNIEKCVARYMACLDKGKALTFYLNWNPKDESKSVINMPFYEVIQALQNLEMFDPYYVAFKLPVCGKVAMNVKKNIRVDVIKR